MTYVDSFKTPYRGMLMSHMLADTVEELHSMAARVGLRREWFQPEPVAHYDLCQKKRALAIKCGATIITRRECAAVMRQLRKA